MRRTMTVAIAALALILGAGDATAQFGGALWFDGGDRVEGIVDGASSANGTIEAFVIADDTANRSIVGRTDSSGPESQSSHQLRINGGKFEFYLYTGTLNTVTGTTTVVAGETYHVAGVYTSGGQMRLFVDGVEEGTPRTIGTAWLLGDRYVLGANTIGHPSSFPAFLGTIDEVRISSVVRYSSNFTRPTGPFTADADTVHLLHLDDGSGQTATNSGTGSDGTLGTTSGTDAADPTWVTSPVPVTLQGFVVEAE